MIELDQSQRAFCDSKARNIRLLAPAGCGKTAALLHRCLSIANQTEEQERFLLVSFTTAARDELAARLAHDDTFEAIRDRAKPWTLNSFAWDRLQERVQHARLLATDSDRRRAMQNQLQEAWVKDERIKTAVSNRWMRGASRLMDVVDALMSLGFDHQADKTFEKFYERYQALCDQGLEFYIEKQLAILAELGVLDPDRLDDADDQEAKAKMMHLRFFKFWRRAMRMLGGQSCYTYNGQKYWFWVHYRTLDQKGVARKPIRGGNRFHHVIVDEFQDVDPLDIAMINAIVERHEASLVITGDDDQAIYEWRGGSPEYILSPKRYLHRQFTTMTLSVNYRSPQAIVEHSQKLIKNNRHRRKKEVVAAPGNPEVEIQKIEVESVADGLQLVARIADRAAPDQTIGVISRMRAQLIPYLVYFTTGGGPVYTAEELDAFNGAAFKQLIDLLDIWRDRHSRQRSRAAIADALEVLNLVKRWPLNPKDRGNLEQHLQEIGPTTCADALAAVVSYHGPKLAKGKADELSKPAIQFMDSSNVGEALQVAGAKPGLKGLRFDWEKAEDDVWHAGPPLAQLADMADAESMSVDDLVERLREARERIVHPVRGNSQAGRQTSSSATRPMLHLTTTHRAKGKEFDTIVLADVDDRTWPPRQLSEAELEAERRLFSSHSHERDLR